jgi:Glyoxalase-like domain
MAAVLDHIHMGSMNVYTSAYNLTKATKIGHYDGGFMSSVTVGHKAVPLGGRVYIEIESIVDPFAVPESKEPWWYKKALAAKGEIWSGLCLRVDTMEELGEIAKRHGGTISPHAGRRTRPDGPGVMFWSAPSGPNVPNAWETGMPNWYCWEDRMYCHPSGQPVINTPGLATPQGLDYLEMGGTEKEMEEWLGQPPSTLKMRFNGKSLGLYAIGVKTDKGIVEIRRPSATV